MVFSDIEKAVLNGDVDAGLIIHENRFTYHHRGLHKIMDMGEFWEAETKSMIPLGGIVVRRNLDESIQNKVDRVLHRSVQFAFENPESSMEYVKENAQEMAEDVMRKHIQLYVNEYSVNLGKKGFKAVKSLFNLAVQKGIIPQSDKNILINNKLS